MIKILAAAAVLLTTAAPAQVTSYERNNPAPVKGNPNTMVCKKDETLGTRLGARKVCLTVQQWTDKAKEHREFTEKIQSGTLDIRK